MKFRYDTRYTEHGFEMVPRIPVVFKNPRNGREIPIFCLVDSGASDILITTEIALALGIEAKQGKPRMYGGVGGEVKGYVHTLAMKVMNDKNEFTIECGVLPLPAYDGLLGQRGFFDNYKVTFEKYKRTFEVIARK
ncbi:MAG: retropepsin-like aspartic protease [Patescibacteria group bacterium]